MSSGKVILCDLGGVLIDLHWVEHARGLFGKDMAADELKARWLSLGSVREFEAGNIDFQAFYELFCSETSAKVAFDKFKSEFVGIIGPVKPGCYEILDRLAGFGRLAMLSNTNYLHVEHLKRVSKIFAPFADLFFSYELRMVKPDRGIFAAVADRLGCAASDILFFDDSQTNIDAATSFGMHGFRVDSPQEIAKIVDARLKSGML